MSYLFVNASVDDRDEILHLYKSFIGVPGCCWNETYPTMEHIDFDLRRDSLFVIKTDEGEIVATITIDSDQNVEMLPLWSAELRPGRELSRVCVKTGHQHKGLVGVLFENGMAVLRKRGYKSAHYLVAIQNEAAKQAYHKLNFKLVGETDLYGEHYLCYEKEL